MIDSPVAPKKDISTPDIHGKLQSDAAVPTKPAGDTVKDANQEMVASGKLPALSIDDGAAKSDSGSGAMAVVSDLGKGALNQIENHPLQVLENAAIGAGIGAAAVLAGPEIAAGAAVVGIGYAGYQLFEHVGGWWNDAKVVADQSGHSQAEVDKAHADLQQVGAGGVNVAAGIAGGFAGGYAASAISSAAEAPAAASTAGDSEGTLGSSGEASPAIPKVEPGSGEASPAMPKTEPGSGDASPAMPKIEPGNGDASPAMPKVGSGAGDASPDAAVVPPPQALDVTPKVDLENPSANTDLDALRAAFRTTIEDAKATGAPLKFNVDTRVPLTDASGAPSNLTQAQVLYQELQSAYPDNQFVFSKPDLSPGDPGYTEFPAVKVWQDGLRISTDENAITLAQDTTLSDGTTLPAGSKFANGVTYDGAEVKSAMPGGKVWATTPDGEMVQVAGPGESAAIPKDALSTAENSSGQVANILDKNGGQSRLLVRSSAKAVDPDGKPLLDTYPTSNNDFQALYKEGTQPGLVAAKPKVADHFALPSNMTIEAQTNYGTSTASGADQDYFMKSGFADAQSATAKTYWGPTSDAQSAAEIARIRALHGLN